MIYDLLPMPLPAFMGVATADEQPPFIPMKYVDTDNDARIVSRLIESDDWAAEQKMDGTRAFIHVTHQGVDWRGLKHSAAAQHFASIEEEIAPLALQPGDLLVLDGEILIRTGEYHVFDLPYLRIAGETVVSQNSPLMWRREVLERLFDLLEGREDPMAYAPLVRLVRQVQTTNEKAALLASCEAAGVEGIVLKNLHRPYVAGRTDAVQKVKFVKTADVVVLKSTRSRNAANRETGAFTFGIVAPVEFAMTPKQQESCEFVGDVLVLPLGNCSAIGKPDAKVGDVIEVAYLYRDDSGGLVQPRMVRIREDKEPRECGPDQFPGYSREAVR